MLVSKRELALLLHVTLPTIANWLDRWPDFPVVERGSNGRAWQFDGEQVCAFIAQRREEAVAAKQQRADRLAQMALPLFEDEPADMAASSPAALLALARLRRLEREEATARGQLVDAARMQAALTDVFGRLGRGQRSALRLILVQHGVAADAIAAIGTAFEALQRNAVEAIRQASADAAPPMLAAAPELRLVAG